MFEAIDEVVLRTGDAERALRLYVDHFGFTPAESVAVSDAGLLELWGCPSPVTATLLVKPGSTGGAIRVLDAPGTVAQPPRRMHTPGPFAIDFYVRDMLELHQRLLDDGFTFRSPPQHYPLFGTTFEVDEVLLEGPEGFLHAMVEYLPRQHRCVLGERPDEQVSEVVAQVTITDDLGGSLAVVRDALGGQVYFDEEFSGPVVERLIDLPPGSAFRAVIMRGPNRRNARLELMTPVGARPPDGDGLGVPPRLFPSIGVVSLSQALGQVAHRSAAVAVAGPVPVPDDLGGGLAATLSTAAGVFVQLRELGAG